MSALSDVLQLRTNLSEKQVQHLQRLVGEWQLLSDLAFADLLLWVPVAMPDGETGSVPGFLCVAQCRPTTGPTAYVHDQVGAHIYGERALPLPWRTGLSLPAAVRSQEKRLAVPVQVKVGELCWVGAAGPPVIVGAGGIVGSILRRRYGVL